MVYQLERLFTAQNLKYLAIGIGVYVVVRKFNKIVDGLKNTFSMQNVNKSVVEGSKTHAVQMANNPLTLGILTSIATNAAKKAPAKKEPVTKPVASTAADRLKRAKMLQAEFSAKKHLRIRMLQAVNASIVKFDNWGAVITTTEKKFLKNGETLERGSGFIKSTTGQGFLVISDVVNKKFYTVNPFVVTLV